MRALVRMVASTRAHPDALRAFAALVVAGWLGLRRARDLRGGRRAAFDRGSTTACMVAAGLACLLRAVAGRDRAPGVGAVRHRAPAVDRRRGLLVAVPRRRSTRCPIPSPADVLYLALYPAFYVALVAARPAPASASVGDAWAWTASSPPWRWPHWPSAAAFGPIFGAAEGDALAVATNLAYPLVRRAAARRCVVGMTALAGRRPGRSWLLLAGGLALMAVADSAYVLQSINGTYVEGGLVDLMWPTAALLVAAAAWSPPEPVRTPRGRPARLSDAGGLRPGRGGHRRSSPRSPSSTWPARP